MAEEHRRLGQQIMGTIIEVKGHCSWGHKVGDKLDDVSIHSPAGLCGVFYHDLYPWIMMLQFGGSLPFGPDPNVVQLECTDRRNAVKIELRRIANP